MMRRTVDGGEPGEDGEDTYAIDMLTDEAHGPLSALEAEMWQDTPLVRLLKVKHHNQQPPETRRMMLCLALIDTARATIH